MESNRGAPKFVLLPHYPELSHHTLRNDGRLRYLVDEERRRNPGESFDTQYTDSFHAAASKLPDNNLKGPSTWPHELRLAFLRPLARPGTTHSRSHWVAFSSWKRLGPRTRTNLVYVVPEAVSQAIALLNTLVVSRIIPSSSQYRFTSLAEVRFCLSNGRTWIFFVLIMKMAGEELTYYESAPRREVLGISDMPLKEIFVCEWMSFFSFLFFFFEQKNNCRYNHLHHIKYL